MAFIDADKEMTVLLKAQRDSMVAFFSKGEPTRQPSNHPEIIIVINHKKKHQDIDKQNSKRNRVGKKPSARVCLLDSRTTQPAC